MRVYKCLTSDQELFTDAKSIITDDEICAYCIESKMVTISNEGADNFIGANASAEEPTEQCETLAVRDKDVVLEYHYKQSYTPDAKQFISDFKEYLKSLKAVYEEKYPDQVQDMMEGAKKYCDFVRKKLKSDVENCEMYCTDHGNGEGHFKPFMHWKDGEQCFFYYFKYAAVSEKV